MLTSNTHLVRRKEYCAVGALDALGAGRVVPRRDELTAAAPGAVVHNLKSEAVREPRGGVVTQEALAEPLSLTHHTHHLPCTPTMHTYYGTHRTHPPD